MSTLPAVIGKKFCFTAYFNVRRACGIVAAVLVSVTMLCAQQPIEKGYKIINGVSLYYETIGEGVPIVIVHGGPGLDHSYLLPQMGETRKRL